MASLPLQPLHSHRKYFFITHPMLKSDKAEFSFFNLFVQKYKPLGYVFKETSNIRLYYWEIGEEIDEKIEKYQNILYDIDHKRYSNIIPS